MSALTSGAYLARLIAMRELLADRLERAGFRDVAAIAKQLADVDARIEELSVPEETDSVDELTQRRAARRAEAATRKPAASE